MTHPWHQDPKATGAEERQAIVDFLEKEAQEAFDWADTGTHSEEMLRMAISRCAYYRQAASFISWGCHLREIKEPKNV